MKFSIRDLLWLTVVVAMAVGWWLDRQPKPDVTLRRRSIHLVVAGKPVREFIEERRWQEPIPEPTPASPKLNHYLSP